MTKEEIRHDNPLVFAMLNSLADKYDRDIADIDNKMKGEYEIPKDHVKCMMDTHHALDKVPKERRTDIIKAMNGREQDTFNSLVRVDTFIHMIDAVFKNSRRKQ